MEGDRVRRRSGRVCAQIRPGRQGEAVHVDLHEIEVKHADHVYHEFLSKREMIKYNTKRVCQCTKLTIISPKLTKINPKLDKLTKASPNCQSSPAALVGKFWNQAKHQNKDGGAIKTLDSCVGGPRFEFSRAQ
ncbi:hypothetical protein LXL04_012996 [Taraxacum kok-saghyz]